MEPKFSIVLITRNEEHTLPRLLESLNEFKARGGDVNICDTGSTDKTVEIGRAWGANVKEVGAKYVHVITPERADEINRRFMVANEMPVVNEGDTYFDFAAARNDSVSMAKKNMVCTADADEIFTRLNIDKLNQYIAEGFTQFEYNFVFSHTPDGRELIKFVQSKMYDRTVCNWVGIIHEMVTNLDPSKPSRIKLLDESDYKLEHWQNEKTNRTGYLRGLAVDCFLHPEKDRNSHYFAREMWWNGRPWSAAKEFLRHIEMNGWPAERAESMLFLADIYGAMEHPKEQIEWAHKALALDSGRREPLIKLAQIYQRRNEPTPTNFYATAAMEIPWAGYYGSPKQFYENEPHELLYWAKGWLGDIPGAQKHILKCFEYDENNPMYWRDARYYFEYPGNQLEGWMTFKEQTYLFTIAKRMESICEVGSWKGRSTHALLSGCKGKVTAVDTWKGSQDERDLTKELAKQEDVYQTFKKNVGHFTNLKTVRKDSLSAAATIPDRSFDMVFIDAEHTYEGLKADIRAWKPKAKILLCGHDYSSGWPGVVQAVDEELGGPDEVHGSIWVKYIHHPKISVCIPTLGRPQKLHRLLESIKQNAGYNNYEVIVKADEWPPNNVGAPTILKRCVDESAGDLVMFLGNDCVMEPNCVQEAVWAMARHFPDMDGMVGLNDGYWQENHVAPHFLISKKLLPYLDGEIFHTGYHHTGCDNELRARVEMIDKYAWAKEAKIFHDHPMMAGNRAEMDELYAQAYGGPRHEEDDRLYAVRAQLYGFADRKWT